MLPPTSRATPAFGSGQPAGTELSFANELGHLQAKNRIGAALHLKVAG